MTSFFSGVAIALVLAIGTYVIYEEFPISMVERTEDQSVIVYGGEREAYVGERD
ncbi:MAG: hypothetical protein ACU0AT_13560 [Tranquillimonas sp.]|jgi:hypothetical protein